MNQSLLTMWNKQPKTLFEFTKDPPLQPINIDAQSTIMWCPHFLTDAESTNLYQHLLSTLDFEHSVISLAGKLVALPRLQAWFADNEVVVDGLYQKQTQHPWTETVRKIKLQLEKQLGCTFVYCLVNLYRDGGDHIAFHSDSEVQGTVASLSVGVARRFILQHYSAFGLDKTKAGGPLTTPEQTKYEFSLANGSMIAMCGGTQLYWKVTRREGHRSKGNGGKHNNEKNMGESYSMTVGIYHRLLIYILTA